MSEYEPKHTADELRQWQALPLNVKALMTQERIRQWVRYFGEDGVCVSFSGGKDSTVLLDIARKMYPDIKAVFSNTGLEYPEIQRFVRQHENVDIVAPDMRFPDVLTKYGYPLIDKEVAEAIHYARKMRGGVEETSRTAWQKKQELSGERTNLSKQAKQRTDEPSSQEKWGGGATRTFRQNGRGECSRGKCFEPGTGRNSEPPG